MPVPTLPRSGAQRAGRRRPDRLKAGLHTTRPDVTLRKGAKRPCDVLKIAVSLNGTNACYVVTRKMAVSGGERKVFEF